MEAIVCTRQGTPVAPNIRLVNDWPEPGTPGPGHVVIDTLCTALNQMDLWVGRGVPGLDLTYPRVSGCDACGVVTAIGEGVDPAWKGKQVMVNAAVETPARVRPGDPPGSTLAPAYELIGEHRHGMLARRFGAPAANLAVVEGVEPVDAAAFGLCALTAWSMMVTKGGLRPGQSVLITGIGGGVATAALAIAQHCGCPTIVTSRHASKLEKARALGAAHGVLDTGSDFSGQVRTLTGKRGVDMAVDSSGKATHLWCIKSLARGGTYATPGCTSGPDATTDLARIFWNQLRVLGSTMGTPAEFGEVAALLRAGRVRAAVDRTFTPGQCAAAYQRLEASEQFGKIVIDWRA